MAQWKMSNVYCENQLMSTALGYQGVWNVNSNFPYLYPFGQSMDYKAYSLSLSMNDLPDQPNQNRSWPEISTLPRDQEDIIPMARSPSDSYDAWELDPIETIADLNAIRRNEAKTSTMLHGFLSRRHDSTKLKTGINMYVIPTNAFAFNIRRWLGYKLIHVFVILPAITVALDSVNGPLIGQIYHTFGISQSGSSGASSDL
ncbi:hypothetical protein VNO77_38996 [Canavalia gladiata]|uniref:Uncharacterized protein n=1 Tax=Canavalia gladiata TaxID=3824 RepID=A0AAN9K9M3_CANGL